MGRKAVTVAPHLTEAELEARGRAARDADELRRWQAVAWKLGGMSAAEIAKKCHRRADWVRRVVHRYNVADQRRTEGRGELTGEDAGVARA